MPLSDLSDGEEYPLEVGDLVRLHSGGPAMTIKKIEGDVYTCIWFDVNNSLEEYEFDSSLVYWVE